MLKTNDFTNRLSISFEICTLFQKLVQEVVNKRTSNMTVYLIQLDYQLTEHPENFKIKLYFQERLSL